MLFKYLRASFARKKARRFFREYPWEINRFSLPQEGEVEFANWKNPLVSQFEITQAQVNFFKQFISAGDLAIDIGGNVGDTTVPMALAAGKEGLVLAFDPNPYVFRILEVNAGLNTQSTNIIPLPYAITEQDGDFFYASSEASFSNGGISVEAGRKHGAFRLKQKIKGINLEKMLDDQYSQWISKLSFIKIDTEGYDKEIIRSISGLLQRCKPVIVAECFGGLTATERKELYDLLVTKGYELFYFGDFEEGTKVEPILNAGDMNRWKHFNFYAKLAR